ncbi:MAG: glycosyltransferase family 39 protein [Chloroflexi bacterium]|nr:glycosyltransferase family 39 protein [Chloroflexota bacterium]
MVNLPNKKWREQRYLLLAVGILLLAAFMRLGAIASVPNGMDNDEAFHLMRAQEILRGESLPIYITGNNGNEPLYAYTAAIGLALVGPTAWAGRLMAAFIGLLGVAITIRLGAEMFPGRRVGLLAGLVLSTLFWHVDFSRFGSQPILAATAAAGTLAALWRGARTGSYRYYFLAGVCLSLGLDAYVAFRLFPIVPLVGGIALWLSRPKQRTSIIKGGVWAMVAALIVYSPLIWYFTNNPQWFLNRFGQTTEGTLNASSLLTNALLTFAGMVWQGTMDWRFNIAGRPALDLVQTLFLIVAVIFLVRHWRKAELWTLATWVVIGLAPSMLTNEAPHFGRTTMATSALAVLVALGAAVLWQVLHWRWARALIVTGIAVSVIVPVWLYFDVWANDPRAAESFDVRQRTVANTLNAAPSGAFLYATPLNVGWIHDYWTTEFLLGDKVNTTYTPLNGMLCTVVPAAAPSGARYVIVASPEADDWRTPTILQQVFPNIERSTVSVPGDRNPMIVYDIAPGAQPKIDSTQSPVDFGNLVRLVKYQTTPQLPERGKRLQFDLVWQTLDRSSTNYNFFVQLLGAPKADGSPVYAQYDGEPCAKLLHTTSWFPNQLLFETFGFRVPADLPPGKYELQVGWYVQTTGERLSIKPTNATSYKLGDLELR